LLACRAFPLISVAPVKITPYRLAWLKSQLLT
jgi:hypothetical protein